MALEIPNLSDLLKHGRIIKQDISRLTAPGENFGSLMLKVDVTVEKNGKQKVIHTVAKCVPPNKGIQKIFDIQTTFKNEIGWYKEAIPALLQFQKEQGVESVADFFMNVYGARHSLNSNGQEVDENGVILCENLFFKGFKNVDRRIGFNWNQSKEIIKKLAVFHAIPMALRLKEPEMFNQKIKPYLHLLPGERKKYRIEIFQGVLKVLKEHPETVLVVPRVEETIKRIQSETGMNLREPWITAIHTDFWVNNIMLKEEEEEGIPPKVIILDLQTCGFRSPVADLLFFLGTSIETSIAEDHFDDIIKLYYEEFIKNVELLNVDISLFPYESFVNELAIEGPEQFVHSMFFVAIIMAVKGVVADTATTEFNPEVELKKMFSNITAEHKEKYVYLTKKFAKRNWI